MIVLSVPMVIALILGFILAVLILIPIEVFIWKVKIATTKWKLDKLNDIRWDLEKLKYDLDEQFYEPEYGIIDDIT